MEEKFGMRTKMLMLKELKEKFSASPDFVMTNYKGLSSQAIEMLRKDLGKSASRFFVVKNAILKRAFDELNLKDFSQFIKGEVGIGFIRDPIEAFKVLVKFSKKNNSFKLSCAYLDGKLEGIDRIEQLAALPSREVMLAITLAYLKSPITGFVGTLKALLRNFVYAINEIKNEKSLPDGRPEGGKENG